MKKKLIYILICIFMMLTLFSVATTESGDDGTQTDAEQNDAPGSEGSFSLVTLDVGQGLCVFVESDGKTMLYDGGGRSHSSKVVSFLKQRGVTELDLLFASHYDEDHIAGLIGVLKSTDVRTAVIPEYEADTSICRSFLEAVKGADETVYAAAGESFVLGETTVELLYACTGNEKNENDRSTVIRISRASFSGIITGDAESDVEKKLILSGARLDSTLYIAGHHGSRYSSTPEFVRRIEPEIAFISVGEDNEYGHPAEDTLDILNENGASIYRTDIEGDIYLSIDGGEYSVNTAAEQEVYTTADHVEYPESDATYVLNTGSMRFHRPDCASVERIADHNKKYTTGSREELIGAGFSPCGICRP